MRFATVKWDGAQFAIGVVLLIAVWEILYYAMGGGSVILPAPSRIFAQMFADRELYYLHGVSTIGSASAGFAIGCAIAVLAALLFALVPGLETVFRGLNIALFAMPAIVVGPLLVLLFSGNWPQIILASIMVYYPAMSATLLGLKDVDPRLEDVVSVYGGRRGTLMRYVRLRGALPSLFAGLRTAAPLAVLGAILGEFGSGTQWGFGSFLLSALPQANPARLWGIGLASSVIALAGYALFLIPARWLAATTSAVTLAAPRPVVAEAGNWQARLRHALVIMAAIAFPFFLWWLALELTHLSPIIAPGPLRVLDYLTTASQAPEARAALMQALSETVPIAVMGLLAGLAFAFVLAALSILAPALSRALLPIAMVAQNMPLVAMVPLVLLVFGRGVVASIFMAVLVVFFPAFVMLSQGFSMVPRAASDLVSVYGGGRTKRLLLVAVPHAMPYLFAAAKLVAPQALLGVMVAEWLLTGIGLGNLLNVSRGMLNYDMIWAGALVSVFISIAAFQGVVLLERLQRR